MFNKTAVAYWAGVVGVFTGLVEAVSIFFAAVSAGASFVSALLQPAVIITVVMKTPSNAAIKKFVFLLSI